MSKSQYRLIALVLIFALAGLAAFAPEALAKKKKKKTTTEAFVYQPPTLQLTADQTVITACANERSPAAARVQLNAKTSFPYSATPRYRWSASGGRIEGDGPNPTWNLAGVQPGYYKAYLEVDSGAPAPEECSVFSSVAVLVKCSPIVCPSIIISCPDKASTKQPVTFSATVTGGSPSITPTYGWAVSGAKIISGEGTNTITVDTAGLAGQSIRATLTIPGYDALDCSASCVVQIPPEAPVCRPFDPFPNITRNDEKARLDNYAIQLQNDPTSTAYIIVYPGQKGRPGEVQQHITRIVDYLVNSRGIDRNR